MPPSFDYWLARIAGAVRPRGAPPAPQPARPASPGITVVIPSRNGRDLLAAQMPGIAADLEPIPHEIVIVDNGSGDGTAEWLLRACPAAIVDVSPGALSFAHAVNRGIARARFSHVCLLNNDMLVEPGFFRALQGAFDGVPDLFCATAQIRFPAGVRREETGKAVMARDNPADFPLRCDEPLPGEDGTPVLYGSGGCSLYHAEKLRALGCLDETYEPAYVEDLDIGFRAWQRAWPSVYVAGAVAEHRHRATTSRYYTEAQLDTVLEVNFLKFLARAVYDRALFKRLWREALDRLLLLSEKRSARAALRQAASIARAGSRTRPPDFAEHLFLALTNGCAAVFPGSGEMDALEPVGALAPPSSEALRAHREIFRVAAPRDSAAFQAALAFAARKRGGVR